MGGADRIDPLLLRGRLDVLVNAAGIALNVDIEETSLEQFQRIHAVNVDGCATAR